MKCYKVALVLLLIVALFHPLGSAAQTSQGRFSGEVTDSSGAVVANATVTIVNLGTHVKRVLQTNSSGDYVAPSIDPGFYSITVEAQGFSKVVRERVQVEVTNDIKIDFQLKPGAVNEVVEVTDEPPLTEATNDVLTGVLSNKAINELPVQGRDFQNLLTLHPGVQRTPGGGFHSTSSNGNRLDDNNFIIDGANDNDAYWGETVVGDAGVQGTPASLLPLDAITEFTTIENPQADYGVKPGVVVSIGLKSGTNNLHGTAYYFHRNSAFDARNYFNPSPDPFSALLLHQFGASIGGPIRKDKLFYFANYEGVRSKVGNPFAAASPVTVSLATPANPAGDPKRSLIDARSTAIADGFTVSPLSDKLVSEGLFLPNLGGTFDPNTPELIDFDFNNVNRSDNLVFKTDYHPNANNTISGRFFYANTNQTEEDTIPVRPEWLSRAIVRTQVLGVDWTWTPSSRLQNQAAFSYNQFWEKIAPVDSNVNPAEKWGLDTGVTDPNLLGFPTISPGSLFDHLGGNTSWPLWTTPSQAQSYSDTVSLTIGRHTLRFGGTFDHGSVDYLRGNNGRGSISFRDLEHFFAGEARSNGHLLVGDLKRNVHQNAFAGFINDDYRIRRHVTLNLGLRYDLTFPVKEDHNLIANFVPNVGIVQVGRGIDSPYPTRYNNLSPRVGVAWDVFGTGKTVLRAGGGIIFERPVIRNFINSAGLNFNPSGIAGITPGNGNINSFQRFLSGSDINFTGTGPVFDVAGGSSFCDPEPFDESACDVFGTDPKLRTPYVANWNLNVQQALTPTTLLQVAYVGNRGIKLYSNVDINQSNPALSAACILHVDDFGGQTFGPIDAYANVDYLGCEQAARPFNTNCPVTQTGGLGTGGQCFPSLEYVSILGNQSSSIYHALQVTLTKRYSRGLYLLAGYSYGHAIDTSTSNLGGFPQNNLDYAANRGNGDYDIRHRFTLSATYDIPSIKSPLQLLEGWQVTSILTLEGGEPFTFSDGTNDASATAEFSDRWNISGPVSGIHWTKSGEGDACNPQVQLCFIDPSAFALDVDGLHVTGGGDSRCITAAGNQDAIDQLGNVGCFIEGNTILTPPALGTFGNLGRNTFRGPSFKNLDFSASKVWRLSEKLKLQFRGEFFNILNHTNFDVFTLHSDMGDGASLGQVVATPDVGVANPVVGSGGSRHIQLGLKLVW